MNTPHKAELTLFLVEDDDVSILAVQRALKKLRIANRLVIARDGVEALAMVRGTDGHTKLVQPYLTLLDINMPRMDGFEFLEEIRKDSTLAKMIVFILTTSSDDDDIERAYAHNVAGYVVKSDAERTLQTALDMIGIYWRIVELPHPAA